MSAAPWMHRLDGVARGALMCLLLCLAGAAIAAAPDQPALDPSAPSALLARADSNLKLSDHEAFLHLLDQLEQSKASLSPDEQWRLRYLHAWQATYSGDYEKARQLLSEVSQGSGNATLRFRAAATLLNILGEEHRYQEAFILLSQMLDQLPQISDDAVRYQGLGEVSQLLIAAGQYDLAINYADQMLARLPEGEDACKATYFKLHAAYHGSRVKALSDDPSLQANVDVCVKTSESVIANAMRADIAGLFLRQDRAQDAIDLLRAHYPDVLRDKYPPVTARVEALLAQAYLLEDDLLQAEKFAESTIESNNKSYSAEPASAAFHVLYQVATKRGDFQSALAYHEKYMAADKGYLDDLSATALAYQIVSQQVLAKKQQLDALNKQNVILKLQQALDRKAVENGRLYIALLLTVLGFIALWVYRLKRSQLRFMWLSRLDSLTGICNRKHFLEEAGLALRQTEKAHQPAALIIIDLDHFKQINDTHGHVVGDKVLQDAVIACKPNLKPRDVFGRLGGEEFAVLLPDCTPEQALARAEQLRAAIGAVPAVEDSELAVSASLGVATTERYGYDIGELLVHADHALYRAKSDGRNRVVATWLDDALAHGALGPMRRAGAGS